MQRNNTNLNVVSICCGIGCDMCWVKLPLLAPLCLGPASVAVLASCRSISGSGESYIGVVVAVVVAAEVGVGRVAPLAR